MNYSSSRISTLDEALRDTHSTLGATEKHFAIVGFLATLYTQASRYRRLSLGEFCREVTDPGTTWHVYFDAVGDLCACLASKPLQAAAGADVELSNLVAPYGDVRAIARRLRGCDFVGQELQYVSVPHNPTDSSRICVVRARRATGEIHSPTLELWYTNFPLHGAFQASVAFATRLGSVLLAGRDTRYGDLPLRDAVAALQVPISLGQYHILNGALGTSVGFLTWAWINSSREDLAAFATLRFRPNHVLWNDGPSMMLCDVVVRNDEGPVNLAPVVEPLRKGATELLYIVEGPAEVWLTGERVLAKDLRAQRTRRARPRNYPTPACSSPAATLGAATAERRDAACFVKVPMVRLSRASIIWLNKRVMACDPVFASLGKSEASYRQAILDRCGYVIEGSSIAQRRDEGPASAYGYVDRYGGDGIADNGGSGRSAYVNGYYLKGVGRTPLIHPSTDATHASGGAYLEECVREAIFSEIVAHEFPLGAVPVLAIIDTGVDVVWNEHRGPRAERQAILVRPGFARPAHGEPASFFSADRPHEVVEDVQRVVAFFEWLDAQGGLEAVKHAIERFADGWAQQMAYAFVHRLPHCANVTSNITWDGALVDFGAMSAMPSWGSVRVGQGHSNFGDELGTMVGAVKRLCAVARHFWLGTLDGAAWDSELAAHVVQQFTDTVLVEMLRSCGLPRRLAAKACHGEVKAALARCFVSLRDRSARDRYTIFLSGSRPGVPFDLDSVWRDQPPEHLRSLRAMLDTIVRREEITLCSQRARLRCRERDLLFREKAKRSLYSQLAPGTVIQQASQELVERTIKSVLEGSRRDCRMDALEDFVVSSYEYNQGYFTATVSHPAHGDVRILEECPGRSTLFEGSPPKLST